MDDSTRRDERTETNRQHATDSDESDQRDDLAERRRHETQRPALTRREREDRWPIG